MLNSTSVYLISIMWVLSLSQGKIWTQLALILFLGISWTDTALVQKVVGGKTTNWKLYPFVASLIIRIDWNQVRLCGGSIIHSRWILTAAHCLIDVKADAINTFIGSNKVMGGERHTAKRLIIHENYKKTLNDIALLELNEPILDGTAKKIRLNTAPVPLGTDATLVGWGQRSAHQHYEDVPPLQSVTVQVAKCHRENFVDIVRLSRGWLQAMQDDSDRTLLCTSTRGGKGACVGDSGGPLIAHAIQIGVVSRGTPCATGVPDVYTKVQAFVPWIEKRTGIIFRV